MADPVAFVHDTFNAIWNQKMVGAVYERFTRGIRVYRSCRDTLYGHESYMVEIIERLAAFPDLQLALEEVIWEGNEEQGYRVSIRLNFSGHNLGVSHYGAATHAKFHQSLLMNARIINGLFVELWIAEDERSLVEQLGFDLLDAVIAIEALDSFVGNPAMQDMPPAAGEIRQQDSSRLTTDQLVSLHLTDKSAVRAVLSALWNERQIGVCERFYSEMFTCHWASNRQLEGRQAYQAVVLAQLAAFPDLTFYVDDLIEQRRDDGWYVAVSWTMLGTHAGASIYGRPSGKRVQVAGISQYLIRDQQFVDERTEWNEFRLMQKVMERPHDKKTD